MKDDTLDVLFKKLETFVAGEPTNTLSLTVEECSNILEQLDSMRRKIVDLYHLSDMLQECLNLIKTGNILPQNIPNYEENPQYVVDE